MSGQDPFTVLGVPPTADEAQLAAARRRLARELHPDRGGDVAAMQAVNAAHAAAMRILADRALAADRSAGEEEPITRRPPRPATPHVWRPRERPRRTRRRLVVDTPSFTLDVLPAEAFEALLIVSSWIGEVVDDDPPYALEVLLHEPMRCWCRLELVPDAGGTTVSLAVAADGDDEGPEVDTVRDLWVACLNEPLW